MSKGDEEREDLLAFINSISPKEEPFFIPALDVIEVNPRPGEPYSAAHARACAEKMRELKAELDAITERQDRASSDARMQSASADPKDGSGK